MLSSGQMFSLWTVRLAFAFYAAAIACWIGDRPAARVCWTASCAFFLLHVVSAFAYFHGWSHQAALDETARRSWELFGVRAGAGLYLNYLFVIVWTADVVAIWAGRRPRWWIVSVHSFMGFMFVNAAVIFPKTQWLRFAGAGMLLALGAMWLSRLFRQRLLG